MADEDEAPGPSRHDKGKAMVGEPSDFTSGDDQSDRNEPGPSPGNTPEEKANETEEANFEIKHYKPLRGVPGSLPKEAMCLILTLTSQEVAEAKPKLYLTADEAFLLTDRAETLAHPPRMFSMDLEVYDKLDERYLMRISNHHTGSLKQFLVNTEWRRFVFVNKLKEGDEIWFFRLLDPDSGQPCYAIRHFKHPANIMISSDNRSTRSVPAPELSVAPGLKEKDSVLSKTLTSLDMDPTNPMLYIDDSEAYTLTDCVKLLKPASTTTPMTLSVFDEADSSYKMLLSYCTVSGYTISQDWGQFVRDHKLKAGDRILFYRFPSGDGLDPHYELYYIRKEEPERSQLLEPPDLKRKPGPGSSDNRSTRSVPAPELSVAPGLKEEDSVLSKTLTSLDMDPTNPMLYIDDSEAYTLTDCVKLLKPDSTTSPMTLSVFDEADSPYKMLLSYCTVSGYTISQEWGQFVRVHKLKAGDRILFYRLPSGDGLDPHYELYYIRKEESETSQLLELPDLKRKPGPGSSVAPRLKKEDSVLSKTLTLLHMDPTYPMLFIDNSEAYTLTDCVKLLKPASIPSPMTLSVFDEVDRPYKMLLSYCTVNGYTISQDWGKFVRVHNLKAGDRILFYRFPTGDGLDPYYELSYIRKEEPERSQLLEPPDLKRKPGPGSSTRSVPAPELSVAPGLKEEDSVLSKTLTSLDMDPTNPMLYIDDSEAYTLTDCVKLLKPDSTTSPMTLSVFDEADSPYKMLLSYCTVSGYTISQEWGQFVRVHKLKAGDRILFYRLPSGDGLDPHYELYYIRKEEPETSQLLELRDLKRKPGPGSSVAPRLKKEDSVLSKTLTLLHTDPTYPMLNIDNSEAYTLTDCVKLLKPASIPSPMTLSVFDEVDRPYKMLLSYCTVNGYTISQGWGQFVRVHKLKAGDRILFYRFPTGDGLDPYYELSYIRKEEPETSQLLELRALKKKPGPGSRGLADPATMLTKTLSALGNQKLCFDANEAWLLTGCHRIFENCGFGTILMSLLVYDEGDRGYDMVLTRFKRADGEVMYTLDGGWQRFVDSYGLGSGDKVTIYRIQDEPVYVLRYTRAGLPNTSSEASVAGPRGSGQNEASQDFDIDMISP